MRERLIRLGLVACLAISGVSAIACDKEDRKDVEEGVNEVENEVDKDIDTDGKDD